MCFLYWFPLTPRIAMRTLRSKEKWSLVLMNSIRPGIEILTSTGIVPEFGPFLPVLGLTGTGIDDKTESARIRPGLNFRHRDVTGINMLHNFRGNYDNYWCCQIFHVSWPNWQCLTLINRTIVSSFILND